MNVKRLFPLVILMLIILTFHSPGGATGITTLHSFGDADGTCPWGEVVQKGSMLYGMTSQYGNPPGDGSIFKFDTSTNTLTVLHYFGHTTDDGDLPYGSLLLSSDGATLYGMTYQGGKAGYIANGIIFKCDTVDGNGYQVLYRFPVPDGGYGAHPNGSLTFSADEQTLYGATYLGGVNDSGTIFSVPILGGTPNILHSFDSGANQGHPWGRVLQVGDYLYGMTVNGGANLVGTIYRIPAVGGTLTNLHEFGGTGDGRFAFGDLTLSSDGNTFYGMTNQGGNSSSGVIFSIPVAGGALTYLHHFTGSVSDGATPYGSLTLSADGSYLYGMTYA